MARRSLPTSASSQRRAVALIWVAVTGLVIIGFMGLALDTGYGLLTVHQLQNGADAASLAGALKVREGSEIARDEAMLTAEANSAARNAILLDPNNDASGEFANAIGGDIEIGRYDRRNRIFTNLDLLESRVPNAVRVVARRTGDAPGGPLPILFGPIFGVNTLNVSRPAIAVIAGTTGGGLITLCPDCQCALHFKGNIDVDLTSAPGYDGQTAIQVNSEDDDAMCCDGGSLTVNAPETNIVGDADNKCYNVELDTYIEADSPEITDPLKDLEPPPCGSRIVPSVTTDPTQWNLPGFYPNGIALNSSDQVANLSPGIYCVDGDGLDVRGGTLNAEGVMFYVIDETPTDKRESHVYLGGNATINISPSDDQLDPYWGISIFQARDNHNEATIIGTGDLNLDGTLYFPVAPLEVGGEGFSLGNQLIAWTLLMHGTGTFNVAYDGRFPAQGSKVFLVE